MDSSLRTRSSLVVLLFSALLAACGPGAASDAGAEASTGPKPTCDRIAEACHPLHEMGGTAHECHEFSEASATTELQCQTREAECLAACPAVEAGAGDASSSDAPAGDAQAHDHDH